MLFQTAALAKAEDKINLENNWNEAVDEWNTLHPTVFLDKNDFTIDEIQLDYKQKDKNPIDRVYFYSKRNPTEALPIKKYQISSLHPEEFAEYVVRVYYRKKYPKKVKHAKECFKWWCHDKPEIRVFNEEEFEGIERLITEDCPSLDDCGINEIHSCKVIRGNWDLYEGSDYREPVYHLQPSMECSDPREWSDNNSANPVLSLKHEKE